MKLNFTLPIAQADWQNLIIVDLPANFTDNARRLTATQSPVLARQLRHSTSVAFGAKRKIGLTKRIYEYTPSLNSAH